MACAKQASVWLSLGKSWFLFFGIKQLRSEKSGESGKKYVEI